MDDIIIQLQAILLAALTTTYNKYIYGEVKAPPQNFFPFIEIKPISENWDIIGTGDLRKTQSIVEITIKDTVKNFVKDDANISIIAHIQTLVKRMSERDSTTGQPKATTVLGAIFADLTLNGAGQVVNVFDISYDEIEYDGSYIVLASIRIQVESIIPKC